MIPELAYDCYRYDTTDLATRTSRGRLIPPATSACLWHGEAFAPFLRASYRDVAHALSWLEHEVTGVIAELRDQGVRAAFTLRPLTLTRAAAAALAGVHTAWQWEQELGHERVVVLAVRGHESTDHRPADSADRPPDGRRFFP